MSPQQQRKGYDSSGSPVLRENGDKDEEDEGGRAGDVAGRIRCLNRMGKMRMTMVGS